jgi:hypothetical protein
MQNITMAAKVEIPRALILPWDCRGTGRRSMFTEWTATCEPGPSNEDSRTADNNHTQKQGGITCGCGSPNSRV